MEWTLDNLHLGRAHNVKMDIGGALECNDMNVILTIDLTMSKSGTHLSVRLSMPHTRSF